MRKSKMAAQLTGMIVRIERIHNYAFILPDGCLPKAGHDHFVHADDVESFALLRIGQQVHFESQNTPRGLRAVSVRSIR